MKNINEKGMTLVESLIASAVATVIFLAVIALWIGTAKTYNSIDAYMDIQGNSTFIMDKIYNDIVQAQSIYDYYPTSSDYIYSSSGTLIIRTNALPPVLRGTAFAYPNNTQLRDDPKAWGTDDYTHFNLLAAPGTTDEQNRMILSNTSNRITVMNPFDPIPELPDNEYYEISPGFAIYNLNGTTLTRIIGAKNKWLSSKILSKYVKSITFDCDPEVSSDYPTKKVIVTLILEKILPKGEVESQTLTSRMWLRNKQ